MEKIIVYFNTTNTFNILLKNLTTIKNVLSQEIF